MLAKHDRPNELVVTAPEDLRAAYLAEILAYLDGFVPAPEVERLLEETEDHLWCIAESVAEGENPTEHDFGVAFQELGDPKSIADQFIEAWFSRPSRLGPLEQRIGPFAARVLILFGLANILSWTILQFRVFLPTSSPIHLPWSPAQIRHYFPEPLPFPDFSPQFLLVTGVPLLAPPILGWIAGRILPVRPYWYVYAVLTPMILVSYAIGTLLLPVTDGVLFATLQLVYWLPIGCSFAAISHVLHRRVRKARAERRMSQRTLLS